MKLRTPLNANGPKWSMPRLCATNAVPQIRAVIVRSKAPRNCFMKIPFKSSFYTSFVSRVRFFIQLYRLIFTTATKHFKIWSHLRHAKTTQGGAPR